MSVTMWLINGALAIVAAGYWCCAWFGKCGLKKLSVYTKQLLRASDMLKKSQYEKNEELFVDQPAKDLFEEYESEVKKISRTEGAVEFCDIGDYFNQGYIDVVVNRRFCDQVSGAMTALGMLGTFLGLTLGLNNFDQSTTESIVESINSLMRGMYTAFLTSIVGIVLSLLFSALYKRLCTQAQYAQDDFVTQYRSHVLSNGKADAVNQMLGYQKEQTKQLQLFADNVSGQISESITEAISPMLQHMEHCMEEFTNYAAAQQKEGLDRVVEYFLTSMNASLGNQFDELSTTMKGLNDWQKEAAERTKELTEKLCSSALNVDQVNIQLQKSIEDISAYVEKLKGFQEAVEKHQEMVQQQTEKQHEISEAQEECLGKIQQHDADIQIVLDKASSQLEMLEEATNHVNDLSREQQELLIQSAQTATKDISEAVKQVYSANESFVAEVKTQMDQLNAEMQAHTDGMKTAVESLIGSTEKQVEQLSAGVQKQAEKMQQIADDYAASTKEQGEAFEEAMVQQLQAVVSEMEKTCDETTKHATQQMNESHAAIENDIRAIHELTKVLSEDLENAAKKFAVETKNLDTGLENSLNRTFDLFDRDLSNIAQHLSGTISEMREITEAIPKVLSETEQAHLDAMDHLTKTTTAVAEKIEKTYTRLDALYQEVDNKKTEMSE